MRKRAALLNVGHLANRVYPGCGVALAGSRAPGCSRHERAGSTHTVTGDVSELDPTLHQDMGRSAEAQCIDVAE